MREWKRMISSRSVDSVTPVPSNGSLWDYHDAPLLRKRVGLSPAHRDEHVLWNNHVIKQGVTYGLRLTRNLMGGRSYVGRTYTESKGNWPFCFVRSQRPYNQSAFLVFSFISDSFKSSMTSPSSKFKVAEYLSEWSVRIHTYFWVPLVWETSHTFHCEILQAHRPPWSPSETV